MFTNIELLHEDNKNFVKLTVNQGTKKHLYTTTFIIEPKLIDTFKGIES